MGHVFLDHVVVVSTMHADVDHVAGLDLLKGKLKGHGRIDAPRAHNLVGNTWLCQALDALRGGKDVRQFELVTLAAVQAAAVEKALMSLNS